MDDSLSKTGLPDAAVARTTVPTLDGIEAVLFDAGDILYDRPDRTPAIETFLRSHGGAHLVRDAEVKRLKKEAWRGHAPRVEYYRALMRASGMGATAQEEGVQIMLAEQNRVRIRADVPAVLHRLKRAGYRLGIITNTHETTAEKLGWFANAGIDGLWDVFVNSCEVGVIKPEPEIYGLALSALGLEPPQAVFVAHSAKEIAGATAVGLRTVAHNPDTPEIGAEIDVARFADLPGRLRPGPGARARALRPRFGPGGLPTIVAHRGGALVWPENSMTAFRGAIRLGVDLIETDVHLSADGHPVIMHDPTLERTTRGSGAIADLTAADLSTVKLKQAGEETVSLLDRVLVLIAPSQVDLRLELKTRTDGSRYPGLARKVADMLADTGLLPRTTITSFDIGALAEFHAIATPAGMIALIRGETLQSKGAEAVAANVLTAGVDEVAVSAKHLTEDLRQVLTGLGLRVGAYAVNTETEVARILAMEVTTFTTDIPDYAVALRRDMLADRAAGLAGN